MQPTKERMRQLAVQLMRDPGLADQLPSREGSIVRGALNGQSVYDIAQDHQMSENAVWAVLRNAARAASGTEFAEIETGGFGSDTDPGRSGGYGATGFGDLGNEDGPYP